MELVLRKRCIELTIFLACLDMRDGMQRSQYLNFNSLFPSGFMASWSGDSD